MLRAHDASPPPCGRTPLTEHASVRACAQRASACTRRRFRAYMAGVVLCCHRHTMRSAHKQWLRQPNCFRECEMNAGRLALKTCVRGAMTLCSDRSDMIRGNKHERHHGTRYWCLGSRRRPCAMCALFVYDRSGHGGTMALTGSCQADSRRAPLVGGRLAPPDDPSRNAAAITNTPALDQNCFRLSLPSEPES